MIGSGRVSEGIEITVITYCDFIRDDLPDWLDELQLSKLKVILCTIMHEHMLSRKPQICSPRWDSTEILR